MVTSVAASNAAARGSARGANERGMGWFSLVKVEAA
jgi:hypothetical protein